MKMTMMAILVGASLLWACGGSSNNNNPDLATSSSGDLAGGATFDMEQPPCVMNPVSGVDFLNACTNAQPGDPAKDYPYPDADASEQVAAMLVPRDRTFSTLSLVAAAMYAPYARLSLEWDHNKNALGRTASGAPTTLGSDVITLRGQVVY